jgi:hypothetical protein
MTTPPPFRTIHWLVIDFLQTRTGCIRGPFHVTHDLGDEAAFFVAHGLDDKLTEQNGFRGIEVQPLGRRRCRVLVPVNHPDTPVATAEYDKLLRVLDDARTNESVEIDMAPPPGPDGGAGWTGLVWNEADAAHNEVILRKILDARWFREQESHPDPAEVLLRWLGANPAEALLRGLDGEPFSPHPDGDGLFVGHRRKISLEQSEAIHRYYEELGQMLTPTRSAPAQVAPGCPDTESRDSIRRRWVSGT